MGCVCSVCTQHDAWCSGLQVSHVPLHGVVSVNTVETALHIATVAAFLSLIIAGAEMVYVEMKK